MTLSEVRGRIASLIPEYLGRLDIADSRLSEAMHYALMNGGKRLRPYLVYATCQMLGGSQSQADAAALALEMVHSYSLVHDDLPAMDNDDLRRGKPTCHIAFDEPTAILTGDALLTAAFELLAEDDGLSAQQRLRLVQVLSRAAGASGMIAGQCIDLSHVGKSMSLQQLSRMHNHKTGALIAAAVQMGAICALADSDPLTETALSDYAAAIGLAFQVQDDLLDIEGDTATLGKTQGADLQLNKPTYPALLGLDGARAEARALVDRAHEALSGLSVDTSVMADLADYIITRDH